MRDDYSDLDWSKAKRGQVVEAELSVDDPRRRLILLDPDILERYPDSASVNAALRALLRLQQDLSVNISHSDPGSAKSA